LFPDRQPSFFGNLAVTQPYGSVYRVFLPRPRRCAFWFDCSLVEWIGCFVVVPAIRRLRSSFPISLSSGETTEPPPATLRLPFPPASSALFVSALGHSLPYRAPGVRVGHIRTLAVRLFVKHLKFQGEAKTGYTLATAISAEHHWQSSKDRSCAQTEATIPCTTTGRSYHVLLTRKPGASLRLLAQKQRDLR